MPIVIASGIMRCGVLEGAHAVWGLLQLACLQCAQAELFWQVYNVEGGDHSLKVKGGKAAAESAITRAIKAAATFAKDLADNALEEVCAVEAPPSPEEETGVRRSRRAKHPPKRKHDAGAEGPQHLTAAKSQKRKGA